MSTDRWPSSALSDGPIVVGPRASGMRDRRARGRRGPLSLPGPLEPGRIPVDRSHRDVFDTVVEQLVDRLQVSLRTRLPDVTIAVEEAPLLPPEWSEDIPVAAALASDDDHTHVVVFRRPITARAETADDVAPLVWDALVTQLSIVWDCPPEDVTEAPPDRS